MHVACAVGGNHHHRRNHSRKRSNLWNRYRVVGEDLEKERLELVIGPVDLVDEQDRWWPIGRGQCPEQGTAHEEALLVELIFEVADICP